MEDKMRCCCYTATVAEEVWNVRWVCVCLGEPLRNQHYTLHIRNFANDQIYSTLKEF